MTIYDTTRMGFFDRTIEPCEVIDIPAGDLPKGVDVKLPGPDGATIAAWWSGFPSLSEGDFVAIQRRTIGGLQYVISGVSADTPGGGGGGGGWPFDNIKTVSTTNANANFPTIQDAIDSVGTGGSISILLDSETFTEDLTIESKNVHIGAIGADPRSNTSAPPVPIINGTITVATTSNNSRLMLNDVSAVGLIALGTAATSNTIVAFLRRVLNVSVSSVRLTIQGRVSTDLDSCFISYATGKVIDCEMQGAGFPLRVRNSRIVGEIDLDGNSTLNTDEYSIGESTITGTGTLTVVDRKFVGAYRNWLYDSLSHDSNWEWEGTTITDKADDSYVGLWNILHNATTPNRPDISRIAAILDGANAWGRFVVKQNTTQLAIAQFLAAADTRIRRGKVCSLSFEAKGSNITELRAAVIYWTSTADAITSDVVGTWATGNLTLATNWAYANTPGADIPITVSFATYKIENITIPITANNLAVLIWTPNSESANDYIEVRKVQLEEGTIATTFVGRPFDEELFETQFFLDKSFALGTIPVQNSGTTNGALLWRAIVAGASALNRSGFWKWTRSMRATPTVTLYNPNAANAQVRDTNAAADCTSSSAQLINTEGMVINTTTPAGTSVGNRLAVHYLADARL